MSTPSSSFPAFSVSVLLFLAQQRKTRELMYSFPQVKVCSFRFYFIWSCSLTFQFLWLSSNRLPGFRITQRTLPFWTLWFHEKSLSPPQLAFNVALSRLTGSETKFLGLSLNALVAYTNVRANTMQRLWEGKITGTGTGIEVYMTNQSTKHTLNDELKYEENLTSVSDVVKEKTRTVLNALYL